METAEIVQQFERATGRFARAAVQAAVARRDEVTPALLLILQQTTDRAAQLAAEGDYMAHLYAKVGDLKLQVDALHPSEVFSVAIFRQTQEIEKLAKQLKTYAKP